MPGIIHEIRNALGCFLGPFQRDNQSRSARRVEDITVLFERTVETGGDYDQIRFINRAVYGRSRDPNARRDDFNLERLFRQRVNKSHAPQEVAPPEAPPRGPQFLYQLGAAVDNLEYEAAYNLGGAQNPAYRHEEGREVYNPIYQDNPLRPGYEEMGAADLYNNVNMEPPENDPDYALAEQGPQPPRPGIYFLGGALDAAAGYQEMDVQEEPPVMGLYDPGRSQDEINDERYYHEAENPQN